MTGKPEKQTALMYVGINPGDLKSHCYIEIPLPEQEMTQGKAKEFVEQYPLNELMRKAKDQLHVWKKPIFRGRPGTVYAMTGVYEETGELRSVYTGSGVFLTMLGGRDGSPQRPLIRDLQLAHDAAMEEKNRATTAKKLSSENIWRSELRPIRDLYLGIAPSRRAAFIAAVIHYIMTGVGD